MARTTDQLLADRSRLLGPNVSTFYDDPVHFVKGEGVWLWDAQGRKYLDCYNNVPHVGHCNPRVVDAICRQPAAPPSTKPRKITLEETERNQPRALSMATSDIASAVEAAKVVFEDIGARATAKPRNTRGTDGQRRRPVRLGADEGSDGGLDGSLVL